MDSGEDFKRNTECRYKRCKGNGGKSENILYHKEKRGRKKEQEEAQKKAEEERLAQEAAQAAEEARQQEAAQAAIQAQEAEDSASWSQEGVQVSWDEQSLLAALIYCEAGNQPYEGQVAVGAVVMNRVRSGAYPNTIAEVIYQPGQFGPAMTGWLDSGAFKRRIYRYRHAGGSRCTGRQQSDRRLHVFWQWKLGDPDRRSLFPLGVNIQLSRLRSSALKFIFKT